MRAAATSKVVVDLAAYEENLRTVRSRIPDSCAIMAVVKANGYGLGALQMATRALTAGATRLGVASAAEGVALREDGIESPIVVLLQPSAESLHAALEHDLILTIGQIDIAEKLGDLARSARKVGVVHCEIDTGMGRQGFGSENAVDELMQLTRISNVDIEGVMTHLPSAEELNDSATENQIKAFRQLLRKMDDQGVPFAMAHAANSAGLVNYPACALDMVRPGLMTYGVWPGKERPQGLSLKPVATWTSEIVQLRDLPGGASIGYGRTYKTRTKAKAAIVPVGYADGYPVSLSNRAEVLVRGIRCPVRGQVSMDQIVVDVSAVAQVSAGDTVTLIGAQGHETITVESLANLADTIPYEILTGIGPRVEREYVN